MSCAAFVLLSSPASAGPESGEQLYKQHCASCHSLKGQGGIGLPLSTPSVIASISDDYIHKTIRLGRPGRIMPAFSELSDSQVDAIVGYIRSWGASKLPAPSNQPIKGDASNGNTLFQEHCSKCHGNESEGGKGTGVTFSRQRDFEIMPPALNNPGFLAAASDTMLEYIITHGREGSPMPTFGKTLNDDEVLDLVAFLRSQEMRVSPPAGNDISPEPMTLIYDSPYGFEETVSTAREAIRSHNFRSFPDRFLEQGLTDEFSVNQRQIIIRFCNFANLYEALKVEPRLGTILPCKVTIMEQEDGSVKVYAANIRAQAKLFNNKQLDLMLDNVEENYQDILEEITL
ncbi:MAG: c-type cytochrome [bacterium]